MRLRAHRRVAGAVLVAGLVAGACSATPQEALTISEPQVASPSPTVETAQPTAVPPTAVPPTAGPTAVALSPTAGPTATAVPSPTPTPTSTPDPEATRAAQVALAVELSSLADATCPGEQNESVRCSVARLPMYANDPADPAQIEMLFAYVDNDNPEDVGPVLYLQGGPGVGTVGTASRFVGLPYDVVVFDQRGTGASVPKLGCPEVDELWVHERTSDPARQLGDGEVLAAYDACAQRLRSQGVDFDAFNTTAVAFDTEVLRRLLDEDPWTLWGVSYGTRVAQAIMRDHPAGVRAAVLDSVVPFEIDFFAEVPQNAIRAFTALTEACEAQSCGSAHGDFFELVARLAAEFDATPRDVLATRPVSGEQFLFRVDGQRFIDMVFTQMYSTRQLAKLPRQVARIDAGGLDELVYSYVQRRDPERVDLAIGLYYTTWCREEFPFHDAVAADAFLNGLPADLADPLSRSLGSDAIENLCSSFAVQAAPTSEDLPLMSDIATLVFAGAFDPVTPPQWSRQVADRLKNATYVEMPNHGHGMATTCPIQLRAAFIISPSSDLDVSCARDAGGPAFE